MDKRLNKHVCKVTNGNKKSGGTRSRKPWWTEELSDLWNSVHVSEQAWLQNNGDLCLKNEFISLKKVLIPVYRGRNNNIGSLNKNICYRSRKDHLSSRRKLMIQEIIQE